MKIDYRHEFRFEVRFEMIPACRVQHSRGIYQKSKQFSFFFYYAVGKILSIVLRSFNIVDNYIH